MRRWFLRARFVLSIAFLAGLFWSSGIIMHLGYEWLATLSDNNARGSPYQALSAEQKVHCGSITSQAIIAGAIGRYVEAGIAHESGNQRAENNPWRYTSIANFMNINPDCCSVLARIPGDYSLETQRLGAPHLAPPKLYAVKMAFKEWQSDDHTFTKHDVVLVNCFGEATGGISFDLRRGIF
ncbi:hypothetical protein FHX06_005702 [Rhizobium sp. BK512]|uniref:hypothetical protein n=1 Tax=Rhizobium sp. BK512 TaxID=2587010 RepID=UPI00160D60D1|nr:hypothetical protein [Rhizobium sp. BK512]MBB3564338.1 hypothetical protein [Rhizobium sp. BK512]